MLLRLAACGGAGNDDLLKPSAQGGQSSAQGGSSSASAGSSGGSSPGDTDAGAGGQASSGGDASGAGGDSATGGSVTGGAGGKSSGGASDSTGGVGGKSTGGSAGMAGARTGGAGGGGGRGGAGGTASAGAAGAPATCPGKCDANADCRVVTGAVSCTCRAGFVGNGQTCARPASCHELHQAAPTLASGAYALKPARGNAEISAYCEMEAEGGGWTLALNEGPSFDPTTQGVADAQCYREDCTSLAYSTVPVASDVMLDLRDGRIVAANYVARVTIVGVEARTRGKTVRELFTGGPYYLEKEDNSNLSVELTGARTCGETLPSDIAGLVCNSCAAGTTCDAPVIVFGDTDPGCVDDPMFAFAIGAAQSYTAPWGNCAGWPQTPNVGDFNYYPDNFRVWVR